MPVFEWKGVDSKGRNRKGFVDAESLRSAKSKLKSDGIFPTEMREASAVTKGKTKAVGKGETVEKKGMFLGLSLDMEVDLKKSFQRITTEDVTVFTRLVANLVAANIPIVEALTAIIDQVENDKFKRLLSQIRERVNEGSSLSKAMADHPTVFPPLYTNMVAAGESSGALDVVMTRLAEFTESQSALRSKILSAMTYPILMLVVMVGIVGILFVVVIPKITAIFDNMKVALPIATKLLIFVASVVSQWWWAIIALMAGAVALFRWYIKTPKGRQQWDRFSLNAPLFGPLVRMVAVTRFSRTLSTLLASGVPLLTAMDIVKNILDNKILQGVLENARDDIREGESIAGPLKKSGEFPPIVTHMIAIGEKSGQLEEMLDHVSSSYESQVASRLSMLVSFMEPAILIVLAVLVVFIVLSILMPLMQISQGMGKI